MSLLKKILIFSLLIAFQNISAYICVNATANYKMFGSVLRADVLKNPFIMAFNDENFHDYHISYANNDSQLVSQIQKMTKGRCSIILGLFTSQDCLVSGSILRKNRAIGLSPSCSDNHINSFFPYIYTAVPKLSDFSKKVAQYLNHTKNTGIIYAFYQPSDVYSNSGFEAFRKYINKPLVAIPVNSGGNFDSVALQASRKKAATILFFTYPLPSAQILVSLDTNNIITNTTKIIGASSWIFDVSVFKPIKSILEKARAVITTSLVDQKQIDSTRFARNFKKHYHRNPDIVEVLTYDTTRLAARCYRNTLTRGKFNNATFLSCLRRNKYQGISGRASFPSNSPFAIRKIYLINFLDRI